MIALSPFDSSYDLSSVYFLRVRPDFALYDLISSRQYIFNFYAMSQVQPTKFSDLSPNTAILGYANATASAYYRHYVLATNDSYVFTVIPIVGNPALLMKLSSSEVYPKSSDADSWDKKSDNSGTSSEEISVDLNWRVNQMTECEKAGYFYDGGNT